MGGKRGDEFMAAKWEGAKGRVVEDAGCVKRRLDLGRRCLLPSDPSVTSTKKMKTNGLCLVNW